MFLVVDSPPSGPCAPPELNKLIENIENKWKCMNTLQTCYKSVIHVLLNLFRQQYGYTYNIDIDTDMDIDMHIDIDMT